jgi:hypothetical protein
VRTALEHPRAEFAHRAMAGALGDHFGVQRHQGVDVAHHGEPARELGLPFPAHQHAGERRQFAQRAEAAHHLFGDGAMADQGETAHVLRSGRMPSSATRDWVYRSFQLVHAWSVTSRGS